MKKKKPTPSATRSKSSVKQQGTNRKVRPAADSKRPKTEAKSDSRFQVSTKQIPSSIVGVGASAGGLEAFEQLLAALPGDTGMAFVLVQHLAPSHESMLSALLAKVTRMPVIEVKDGMAVLANHVYVIPPNADMSIVNGILHLTPLQSDRTRRMPIDFFLRSLAEDQHGRSIGVILSGTASDGTLGLQAIKALGGVTFAQDDASAKYNAMPRSAVAAGSVDYILPPENIARELQRIANHVHLFTTEDAAASSQSVGEEEALRRICNILRNFSRVDFSHYKPGTINRRITRRMFLRKIEKMDDYVQFLRKNRDEVEALFNYVLINVTGFFRDPDAFEALRKRAFPLMMNNKDSSNLIRIWVPGCSTGEEAYSLAIVLLEYLADSAANLQIQIFATDISESILQKARHGIYPESIAMDMSEGRLQRFFQKVDGGYQISKAIRDICVFAKQDIAKDPPFSKLSLISCRNVMIYMGPVLQKRIIPLFHYALRPNGILFLGSSESVGGFNELFNTVDRRNKIYTRKSVSGPLYVDFAPNLLQQDGQKEVRTGNHLPEPANVQTMATHVLLNRYAPPSVVVNEKLDILQFMGQAGRFLDPTPGDASLNLLRMVAAGLQFELRAAFQKARRGVGVKKEGVFLERDGDLKAANFEIVPLRGESDTERHFLVVFDEVHSSDGTGKKKAPEPAPVKKGPKVVKSETEMELARLKDELDSTREYLQSIIEEQRTTNEELRSANEETQSSNEELQSINEELETAKEELQSTNEELTTVNEELQNRNEELFQLNNDLNNLLSSVNLAIIMLGHDLRIRRFTPVAEKVMNLISGDVGRPITDIKPNLKLQDLRQVILRTMNTLETQHLEVEDTNGKWYTMNVRPYRTLDNKIDGAVIVLLDLDKRLRPGPKP